MFERYTEKTRRSIFWGRYEASTDGSPTIECVHLLLGMLRENHGLLGDDVDAAKFAEEVRLEMTRGRSQREPIPTSVDLPLSHEAKRVLAYGAEEAERMGHKHIGSEHLLLGLLREEGSFPTRLLQKHGIELGTTRTRIAAMTHLLTPVPTEEGPVDRATLHALIDGMPEGALPQARAMLRRMQTWPPEPPEIAERRKLRGILGSGDDVWGSGMTGSLSVGSGSRRDGSRFSSRIENGALIRQTHEVFHGHEISMTEQFKMSEDSKQLKYSQQLHGPNRDHQIEIDFDLT